MSIAPVGSSQPMRHSYESAHASSSGKAAAGAATDRVASTGSVSTGNMAAFFKSFSADLQSMLSQGGNTQTAASKPLAEPHHHHPHFNEGGSGPVQEAARQMTASVGRALKADGAAGNAASVA